MSETPQPGRPGDRGPDRHDLPQREVPGDPLGQREVDAAVASLHAHEAYLAHVTDHPAPEEFIPEILRQGGAAAGTDHAVVLRVHEL